MASFDRWFALCGALVAVSACGPEGSGSPTRMTPLTGESQALQMSLWFPEPPHVGANAVEFTIDSAEAVTFELSTEMWSMGHGAAGNVNPTRGEDGVYRGTAVFSMSGDWLLRLRASSNAAELGVFDFQIGL